MTDSISVNFGALEGGAAGIRQVHTRLTSTLEQLESDLQPMIASWSGAAQESYVICKKRWDDAALELAHLLDSLGQAVRDAHQNYAAAESAARANWT